VQFNNVYEDARRAEAYAGLKFPGTYYLAFRDLPRIITEHVEGSKALDFGCGAGRSTRFLKQIGFDAIGVDIAEDMLEQARARDDEGTYLLSSEEDLGELLCSGFDLIFSAFTFDNIPTREQKVTYFREFKKRLTDRGIIVNLVSSPDIYTHEWASFTTKDFPENRLAESGDRVKIIMTDVEDRRPVEDVLWADDAYREVYKSAGLKLLATHKPLVVQGENQFHNWVNETEVAPWVIYVLSKG
jgi:SAM-dependent methyltransferase